MNKENSLQRKYQKSIFIFRRDLRLKDNTALINALYSSTSVYCFFIIDTNILLSNSLYSSFSLPIDPILLLKHKQRRLHLLRFLKESLLDLQKQFDKLDIEKEPKSKKDNFNTSFKLVFLIGDPASTIKRYYKQIRRLKLFLLTEIILHTAQKEINLSKKFVDLLILSLSHVQIFL